MSQLILCFAIIFFQVSIHSIKASYLVHRCAGDEIPAEASHIKFGKSFLQKMSVFLGSPAANDASGDILENHGSLVVYFKNSASNEYVKGSGCGFMHPNGMIITAAHVVTNIWHPQDGYDSYCCKIHFFSRSGLRYEIDSYYINPLYFTDRACGDFALLHVSGEEPRLSTPTRFYDYPFTEETVLTLERARMQAYTTKCITNSLGIKEIERYEYPIEGTCISNHEYTTFNKINTHSGMSGANSFIAGADRPCFISVHTSGNCEDEFSAKHIKHYLKNDRMSQGITLTIEKQKELVFWHHCLVKQQIWHSLEKLPVLPVDEWRPVLLSIQADAENLLQNKFLKLLQQNLETMSYAKERIPELFQFFALSGHGKNLIAENFGKQLLVPNNFISNPETATTHNLNFSEPTSTDMTLEGVERLQEMYDFPIFVIALGVSSNSKAIHIKIRDRLNDNFIYERINYLRLHSESVFAYDRKIEQEAQRIAELLIQNYLLKYPPLHQKEEPLFIPITTTESISVSLKADLALSDPLSSAIIYS